jgi:hypothetical protein
LYRLKTPSQQVAVVLSALVEGLDASAAERVFGYHQTTVTTWLSRAGEHAQSLHEHFFHTLQIPHFQLDELCTRLAEPPDDGQSVRCSLAPCQRATLERDRRLIEFSTISDGSTSP